VAFPTRQCRRSAPRLESSSHHQRDNRYGERSHRNCERGDRDSGAEALSAVGVTASEDALPPHDPHSRHTGHVLQHPASSSTADSDNPTRRAPGRRRRARDRHHQQPVAAIDGLDMNTVEPEQQVAAGTQAGGRARVSAPRSRVKHVEVLVKIRWLALLILGDLDPYPPDLTRRASPPPNVRRAALVIFGIVFPSCWCRGRSRNDKSRAGTPPGN